MNYLNNEKLNIASQNLKILFEAYLNECQHTKQLRGQTIKGYSEVFSTFQKIMPEVLTTTDLNPSVLNVFYMRLRTRTRYVGKNTPVVGVKTSTIKTYHNKLMVFFKWLEFNRFLENTISNKITKPPNPEYEDERALSQSNISTIISAIAMNTMDDSFTFKRDILIMSLFIYTGIRRQEMLSLKIQDIKFDEGTIFINGKTSKSKKSRYIPLHPILSNHIKCFLRERRKIKSLSSSLIISCKKDAPFTHHGLKHWVERYRRLSGVRFHVHQLRHSFACSLARENANIITIMNALGHSNIKTTQGYLRSIRAEESRHFIEKLSF